MSGPVGAPVGRVLVVVPTYNESQSLPAVVAGIRAAAPDADVLVVDDNSPDGTGTLADAMAADDAAVSVLHRPDKAGLGAAYVAGFRWGIERRYGALVEMDADGSHSPAELPRLLDALRRADVVLGSRWVAGGAVVDWPLRRELLSRGGNAYARLAIGLPLRDPTGGYRVFRASALRILDLGSVQSQGYCFQVDLAWRAVRAGLRVVEVPITFVERELGASKMDRRIVREALLRITGWGIAARRAQVSGLLRRGKEV